MHYFLTGIYAAFCFIGIAIDLYSAVCYVVGHRRRAPSGVPLLGLILYALAGMWRSFMGVLPLFATWELLLLAALHLVCHVIVPLGDRLLLKLTKRTSGAGTD